MERTSMQPILVQLLFPVALLLSSCYGPAAAPEDSTEDLSADPRPSAPAASKKISCTLPLPCICGYIKELKEGRD